MAARHEGGERRAWSSRSEISHHRQPNQWHIMRPMINVFMIESTPGFRNSSKLARYFASFAIRASLASLASRSRRRRRLARAAPPAPPLSSPPSSSMTSPYL